MGQIITNTDFLLYLHQWFWHIKANGGTIESIGDLDPDKNGYAVSIDSKERFFPHQITKILFELILHGFDNTKELDVQKKMETIRDKFIYALDGYLVYNSDVVTDFYIPPRTQSEPVFKRDEKIIQTLESLKEKFRDHNDEVGAQLLDGCIFQILSKNKYE